MVSSQILAPSSACLPLGPSGPVSAMAKPMVIGWPDGAWALAGVRNRATAAVAKNEATTPRRFSRASIASSSWLMRSVARDFLAVALLLSRRAENCRHCRPHTSSATSTIKRSFAHCSSSARILPSSVEAKPHCGDRHNCSMSTYLAASSMRRLMASLLSSTPLLEVTRPSTTCFLPLGTKRSGSKPPARALSVFQEIAVDGHFAEQRRRHELVAAPRDPGRAEIAAAGMHGDRHVGGPAVERGIGQSGIARGQRIGIVAALLRSLALGRRADHCPGGVVELEIAAASVVEGADGAAIGLGHVVEIAVEVGIDVPADGHAALAEMERAGRGNRHLGHRARMRLEEAEMREHGMAGKADPAGDLDPFRTGRNAVELDAMVGGVGRHPVEALEEIEVPPGAPELAAGGELEADLLLLLDDLLDLAVLDLLQLRRADLALLAFRPRVLERRRAQQAAHVIGPERRLGSLHRSSVIYCLSRTRSLSSPRTRVAMRRHRPHTSPASSTIIRSFAHSSSSARMLPSSVEAKPHCGDRQNCSSGANLADSSRRRLTSSFFSSVPLLEVTSPSTTILLPFGRKRSGSKPPARSVSYSRK